MKPIDALQALALKEAAEARAREEKRLARAERTAKALAEREAKKAAVQMEIREARLQQRLEEKKRLQEIENENKRRLRNEKREERRRERLERILAKKIQPLIEEVERPVWDIDKMCHAKQVEFIRDPAKRKVAVCGRRSGKTAAEIYLMLETAVQRPSSDILYLAITRVQAHGLVWDKLLDIVERMQLPVKKINNDDLIIRFKNGSRIIVSGADNERIIGRFRGYGFSLVCIDEAQSFGSHIDPLVHQVIEPSLMDNGGTLIISGTPGPVSRGFFYDTWMGKHRNGRPLARPFKRFHWTILDNPLMPVVASGEMTVQQVMDEQRVAASDEREFRREILGEFADDVDKLVFQWSDELNSFHPDDVPDDVIIHMGVDTGHNHGDAIAVLGYSPTDPEQRVFLLDEWVRDKNIKEGWDDLITTIKEWDAKWNPKSIVIDPAAGGAKAIVSIKERLKRGSVFPADKKEKAEFCRLLNSDLRSGRFKMNEASQPKGWAVAESFQIQWRDHKDRFLSKRTPDGGQHSDIWDAILYAWKQCHHHRSQSVTKQRMFRDIWDLSPTEHIDMLRQNESKTPWWAEKI